MFVDQATWFGKHGDPIKPCPPLKSPRELDVIRCGDVIVATGVKTSAARRTIGGETQSETAYSDFEWVCVPSELGPSGKRATVSTYSDGVTYQWSIIVEKE